MWTIGDYGQNIVCTDIMNLIAWIMHYHKYVLTEWKVKKHRKIELTTILCNTKL